MPRVQAGPRSHRQEYGPVFLLLTGLRRNEGVRPTWDNVDLVARTFTIPDPKNREPHTLPLSDCLCDLLNQRAAEAVNDFVFPGPRGYLADLRDQLARAMAVSEVPSSSMICGGRSSRSPKTSTYRATPSNSRSITR